MPFRRRFRNFCHDVSCEKIYINKEGLYAHQCLVKPNSARELQVENELLQLGFTAQQNIFILEKNVAFENGDIQNLNTSLTRLLKGNICVKIDAPSIPKNPNPKKRGKHKLPFPNEISFQPDVNPEEAPIISWPSGVTSSNQNVAKIYNGINQYICWTLPDTAFGEFTKEAGLFKEKSIQKAPREKNAQGIKDRPTFGIDYFTNQQGFFSARIKVKGKSGDNTVLLETEKAVTGETLYTTRGYQRNIH